MHEPEDTTEDDPLIGRVLGDRYKVIERLGEGGMAAVYLGVHVTLGKRIALKVLKSHLSGDRSVVERFLREAQAASRIGHENIVDIVDFGQTPEGGAFFAMELLEGRDLASVLADDGRLPWSRARGILLQISRALAAAHRCGVVHRDIKPGNVVLVERDQNPEYVKVLDFGIAKFEDQAGLTQAGMVFGTAGYMAPEQVAGDPVDARADVYAMGCLSFELLAGELPYPADSAMDMMDLHVEAPIPKLRERAPHADIPEAVEAAVHKAMAKAPEQRFQDMRSFAEALAAVPASDAPEPEPELPRRPTTGVRKGPPRPGSRSGQRKRPPRPQPRRAPPGARLLSDPMPTPAAHVPVPRELPLLAFVYIAFAHGTDGLLTGEELDTLAERLQHWAPEVPLAELHHLVRHTLADYNALATREARQARCASFSEGLGERLDREQRAAVLHDLHEIARADGVVIEAELRFIVDITERFGLTPDPRLLATAFLYLSLAHADGHLDPEEMRVLTERLRSWEPDSSATEIDATIRWASAEFERRPDAQARLACAHEAAEQLRLSAEEAALRRILADLWRLAGADGHIAAQEQRFIMDMVERFEL